MDRGIGLGCRVIGWRDVVVCFVAVVIVSIIYSIVRVIIWKREEVRGDNEEGRERERI